MNKSIGILDSGIGGISVYREIKKVLPREKFVYLADKNNFPYGEKSEEQIKKILFDKVEWFLAKKVKLVVIACNTATVRGIEFLRKEFKDMIFVGLEPAVKPAGKMAKKGILVLSSKGTSKSKQLDGLVKKYVDKDLKIFRNGNQRLVRAIEEKWDNKKLNEIFENVFKEEIKSEIDVVVLGCSHFPLIKKEMQEYLGGNIKIIDSGEAVAKQVKKVLEENNLVSRNEECLIDEFYSSGK